MNIQKETTLKKRIFAQGETEEWQVYKRVADFLGNDDEERKEFFDIMNDNYFLPNSPCLASAGVAKGLNMQVACFVLPIEDSMESIFTKLKDMAMIFKMGGGVGFNFSKLRPKGNRVGTTNGVASGVISFMRVYDVVIEEIKQGGMRRGAAMGMLNIDHPDIFDFINCKNDLNAINNFNLSIAITDKFVDAVKKDLKWDLIYDGEVKNTVRAKDLYNLIITNTHKSGEPGFVFIDEVNRMHKLYTGLKEEIEATNACGELPLLPFECCCLGSINLSKIIGTLTNPDSIVYKDESFLGYIIKLGIKFLNRMIDKTNYPLPENKEIALRNRKIGLGVMGYADMLIKLGYEYGSEEALKYTESLAHSIKLISRGEGLKYGNKVVNSIAPTGTLSILADCSSGIEPLFALEQHISRMDENFIIVPSIADWYYAVTPYAQYRVDEGHEKLEDNPLFKTANDIPYTAHLETQAIWQKYIDNSISKTINLPSNATVDDVDKSFMLAYELKCKGFTVYRDGCRDTQVLNHSSKKVKAVEEKIEIVELKKKKKRPEVLQGETPKYITGCGNLYVTVNKDEEGNIIEVFTNTGRAGGCPSQSEATSRVISAALREGVSQEEMHKQLKGIRCMSCIKSSKANVLSCPDAIARAIGNGKTVKPKTTGTNKVEALNEREIPCEISSETVCPECGSKQEQAGNCFKCIICGYSKCGA